MGKVTRFSVTISPRLMERFDAILEEKGYANRSEGIRDLIRDFIVSDEWEKAEGETVGTLTLLYDHDVRGVSDKLTELQHSHHTHVLSSMHVHLDQHNCLEVLVIRGNPREIKELADSLIAARGVKHGRLVMTSTGKGIE
ncbi:MAG: nickel-responsive transcriptional regulator NikR [Euryarchaeota archaeon]|nr:nickel-responsive transcriptional regulator NikR [Euryarchaeota archaeon]